MIRRLVSAVFVLILPSVPSFAQSAYVSGALGADLSRVSHFDSGGDSSSGSSDVLSGALRVGTAVTPIWGVELEFARSGRTRDEGPSILPLARASGVAAAFPMGPFYSFESRRRHVSVDALIWARQSAGRSVDLVYLGGLALTRERTDVDVNTSGLPRNAAALFPRGLNSVEYATRPVVGFEARIRMTDHLRLVPGMRVQGLPDGWMIRPAVALAWAF